MLPAVGFGPSFRRHVSSGVTAAQFLALFTGRGAYYAFEALGFSDDDSVATWIDSTANGNTLTSGGISAVHNPGKVGRCISFGGDDLAGCNSNSTIVPTTKLTLGGWAKINDETPLILKSTLTSDGGFLLTTEFPANKLLFFGNTGGVGEAHEWQAHGSTGLINGQWFEYMVIYDGTQTGNANRLKMYINNVQETISFGGTTVGSLITDDASPLQIAVDDTGLHSTSEMDETFLLLDAIGDPYRQWYHTRTSAGLSPI